MSRYGRHSQARLKECPIAQEHSVVFKKHPGIKAAHNVADLCLYHWAPAARRKSIKRNGLVPGKRSVNNEWKPPYICFADDVCLAWSLSGYIHPEIKEWDLYQVYPEDMRHWEIIFDTYYSSGHHYIKEYRVYHRIFGRNVHYVASRSNS